jgi:N-acetylglucosaminyl-diphospho-decaprenol L-rhamnosyltransferase
MKADVSTPAVFDVAVVIVHHNTVPELLACLASLEDGGLDGVDAQVWVVDNASAAGSLAAIATEYPGVRRLENTVNVGYAAANNQALRAAGFDRGASTPRARHALLLNPDTEVPPGAVRQLVDLLDAEDDLGAIGPKLILGDGRLDLACRRSFPTPEVAFYRFSGLSGLFPKSARFGRYNLTFMDPDIPADVDSVVGACMLVKGRAIADVGLLDETFWMYGEDLDWALRLRRAGWRVAYRPQVVVRHVKRAASRGSRRAAYEFQRAMWLFYTKHYAPTTPRPVHWLILLAVAARGGPRLAAEILSGRSRATSERARAG